MSCLGQSWILSVFTKSKVCLSFVHLFLSKMSIEKRTNVLYNMKYGGELMILSREDLEDLAQTVLSDFQGVPVKIGPIDIDRLATEYLGLVVQYEGLSEDQSILGVTTYAPCEVWTTRGAIYVAPNTVLLDWSLRPLPSADSSRCLRRFTLAHECAHQILYRYESASFQSQIGTVYSPRRFRVQEDWNEWQANALGAALLMPPNLLQQAWFLFCTGEKLHRYGGWLPPTERSQLENMSRCLEVSRSALLIRLEQLDFVVDEPWSAYCDPLDVIAS